MARKTSIQNYFYLNLFAPQFPVVTTAHPLPRVEHRVRIPGNIHSPCSAEGLNISTWWNSKDGTAASLHHRTQGSCKDHYAGWMLRGLKSVTWQLLPQHAPSFEGKSSKHTHTLGFDYFFWSWINWIKQTSCSEEIRCFGSTALLSTTSTNTVAERSDGLFHPGSQK